MYATLMIFIITGTPNTTVTEFRDYPTVEACMKEAFRINADRTDNHSAGACLPKVKKDKEIPG